MTLKALKKPPRRVENVPAVKRQINAISYATPARLTGELKASGVTRFSGTYTVCRAAVVEMPEIETDESSEFSFQLLSSSIVPERFPSAEKMAFSRRIK